MPLLLFSVSLSLSMSLHPFRPFRHSPAIIFIFFGNILHFIRHSAACTFTLSLAASHPAWMCRPRRGHPARCSPMRAGIGRLINAYIDGIRTYTHTLIHPHIDTHVRNVSGWRPLWIMLIFSYFSAPNEKCILCKERVVVSRVAVRGGGCWDKE